MRALRLQAGLTQDQTSTALGMALKAYQRLETGRHNPTLDTIGRVAAVLRQPVSAFFTPSTTDHAPSVKLPPRWTWQTRGMPVLADATHGGRDGANPADRRLLQVGAALPGRRRKAEQDCLVCVATALPAARANAGDWLVMRGPLRQPWLGKVVLVALAPDTDDHAPRWSVRRVGAVEAPPSTALRVRLDALVAGEEPMWRDGNSPFELGIVGELVEVIKAETSGS